MQNVIITMQFWLDTISHGREQGRMKIISDKSHAAIRSSIALGIGAAVIALAGCAGSTDGGATGAGCTTEPISQFAVVTPETEADHGWNQQAILGAGEACNEGASGATPNMALAGTMAVRDFYSRRFV
jgi:hypothetical protein